MILQVAEDCQLDSVMSGTKGARRVSTFFHTASKNNHGELCLLHLSSMNRRGGGKDLPPGGELWGGSLILYWCVRCDVRRFRASRAKFRKKQMIKGRSVSDLAVATIWLPCAYMMRSGGEREEGRRPEPAPGLLHRAPNRLE